MHRQISTIKGFGIIIILSVIIGGFFMLYEKKILNDEILINNNFDTFQPVIKQYADWQEFQELLYNFEIRIPSEYSWYNPYDNNNVPYSRVFYKNNKNNIDFSIDVSKTPNSVDGKCLADETERDNGAKFEKTVFFGGDTGYMFSRSLGIDHELHTRPFVYVNRCYDDFLYQITFFNTVIVEGENKLILDSFSFSD